MNLLGQSSLGFIRLYVSLNMLLGRLLSLNVRTVTDGSIFRVTHTFTSVDLTVVYDTYREPAAQPMMMRTKCLDRSH
jgi:hypothetical protein